MKIPIIKIEDVNRICYIEDFKLCRPEAKVSSFVEFTICDIFTNEFIDCVNINRMFTNEQYQISEEAYRMIIRELDQLLENIYQRLGNK